MSQELSGTWEMRLHLVRSPLFFLDPATVPSEIRGNLSLLPNGSLNRTFSRMGVPINYGSYGIDLSPFGFAERSGAKTPTVVVGRVGADSVELILSPDDDQGSIVMIGALRNGVITGEWRAPLARTEGVGTFVLRRSRGNGAG